MLTLLGWLMVQIGFGDPRWEALKDDRVAAIPGVLSPQQVNDWVNGHIRYVPDDSDHWQSPEETLRLRTGDCEDFAILKRALLLANGWPDSGIAFYLVDDLAAHQGHAFLEVGAMIMDDRTNYTQPVQQVRDYVPYRVFVGNATYSFVKG